MNPARKKLQVLIHDNEQDRACMERWWREASVADKCRVWDVIQVHHDDPVQEIVTRFAQLAFGEIAERDARANGETP